MLVLGIGTSTGVLGAPETAWPILLVRFLAVATVTTAVVLLLRRVPIVRTVL